MKTFYLVLFFCLYSILCSGQKNINLIDSLYNQLDKNHPDSTRIFLLKKIIEYEPDFEKSEQALLQLENISKNIKDNRSLTFVFLSRGNDFNEKGNVLQAIDFYYQAARLSDSIGYIKGEIEARHNLGKAYKSIENFKESIKNYRRALQLLAKTDNEVYTAITNINIGFAYYHNGNYDSAEFYTQKSVNEIKRLIPSALNYALGNLFMINIAQNKDGSEKKLLNIIQELDSIGDNFAVADYYVEMASIYYDRGAQKKARQYGEKGYEISKENGFKSQIVTASEILSELYESEKEFERALKFKNEYVVYNDSIMNVSEMQRLANVRTEYEVSQKQAEVDLLAAEKRNQQIITAAVALVLILSLIGIYFIYKNYREKNKLAVQLASQKKELEKLNKTKDKFFSIISHDIRGPVHAFNGISRMIKFLVTSKNTDQLIPLAEEIEKSVNKLSGLLDNLLSWAVQQQDGIPYNPTTLNVKNSLENLAETLKTTAESKNIDIIVSSDESHEAFVDQNTTETIFRNLVSNALKFTQEGGQIHIESQTLENNVQVIISDTGVGIDPEKVKTLFDFSADISSYGTGGEKGLGLGLQLVKEFINLNKGSIEVESTKGKGTSFTVSLPKDNVIITKQDEITQDFG